MELTAAEVLTQFISQPIRHVTNYKDGIQRMRSEFERLKRRKLDVQVMVNDAIRNSEDAGNLVSGWMDRVSETETRVNRITEDAERIGNGFLITFLNLNSIIILSKRAQDTTDNIIELLIEGRFDRLAYPPPPTVAGDDDDGLIVDAALQLCRRFTLAEIQSATQNFNEAFFIGKGGFGRVYKGIVDNGITAVAVKRLDPMSSQGGVEFRTEIEMLSKFRHCNLVSLIGYCHNDREMILVYEFMVNGSLADHLHPKDGRNGNSCILSWVQRLKICIGAARGIDYLHTGTGVLQRVIHRDLKSSNILLDKNWAAKVSDFGLSKVGPANQSCTHVSTRVKGTPGYYDPEYYLTHQLTKKSDVYSFGVILFEVLSGKPALDFSLPMEHRNLVAWAQHCIQENAPHKLIDPNLKWESSPNSLKAFVEIASQCSQFDSKKRPKMAEVVALLELALASQTSKDSSLLDEDIFDFGGNDAIDEQSRQIQGGRVDDGYQDWLQIEDDSEGGKKVETETINDNDDDDGDDNKNISGNKKCKNCGLVEVCVLILPCRHLCICTVCDFSVRTCPVCYSIKDASIQINMYS